MWIALLLFFVATRSPLFVRVVGVLVLWLAYDLSR